MTATDRIQSLSESAKAAATESTNMSRAALALAKAASSVAQTAESKADAEARI